MAAIACSAGIYFGVDGGIPGLHPPQATLLDRPALALRVFGDGVEVLALSAAGHRLLQQPALAEWARRARRAPGRCPLPLLRGFMATFQDSPDLLLAGALTFAAHQLATGAAGGPMLGLLFLAERFFRRDAAGDWEAVALGFGDAAPPDVEPCIAAADSFETAPSTTADAVPADDLAPGDYAAMVQRAVALLQDDSLVSLTLSQCYRRRVSLAPIEAFRRLRRANPAPATFFVNDGGECLVGASPDLQLVISGRTVQALPVCGTVARAPGAVGEAESLRELINEAVDAASLAVCTDALRNDLAPLCEPGSLELLDRRRPMSLATVIHAVDRLQGRLRAGCDAWDAIAATAAPVMVTGTPRAQALAAIEQLEASARGWYGGMVVQVTAAVPAPLPASVSIQAGDDPFAASLADCVAGLGVRLDGGTVCVIAGRLTQPPSRRVLAIGDAALMLLEREGFAVQAITPRQGYPVRCAPTADAPIGQQAFIAARYLRRELAGSAVRPGWTVWAVDAAGVPQALVQRERRLACLLFRPDSLLSQPAAREMLSAALAWCDSH